jgi:probable rRNA maturation factor
VITIETDVDSVWEHEIDWHRLAESAAQAAVRHSNRAALARSGLTIEVSVKFTGNNVVQALNAGYRNKAKPTNVLSFPMIDPELLDSISAADNGEILLGDVVLAHGICLEEAEERGIGIETHAAHLVVHGVLHLLGYDHDRGDEDAETMENVERAALASMGIADPYAATEVHS